jgi:hypothetical protein
VGLLEQEGAVGLTAGDLLQMAGRELLLDLGCALGPPCHAAPLPVSMTMTVGQDWICWMSGSVASVHCREVRRGRGSR